jgi:tripartite ATP-independent transporter DctP family solute receptor
LKTGGVCQWYFGWVSRLSVGNSLKKGGKGVMKRCLLVLLMLVLVISMTSVAFGAKTYTIKVAHWFAEDHPQNISLLEFKRMVEKRTKGNIKVQLYPNCQLGAEETYIESVKKGTVEMGVTGVRMCKEVPTIAICEMPFLFENWDHVQKAMRGPIGAKIYAGLVQKAGVRPLAWTVNGFRQISSRFPINKFEDFKGMRLRLPGVDYYIKMGKALGANPITTPFSELFTSLEQKVADGQDNPYPTVRASKLYEVQKYILETNHMWSPCIWIMNEKFYRGLPKSYRKIIDTAVKEAVDYNWKLSIKKDSEDKKWLMDNGMIISVPDAAFKEKMRDSQKEVYEWYYKQYPGTKELREEIRALLK